MRRDVVVAFFVGVACTAAVLTREATIGDDVLSALLTNAHAIHSDNDPHARENSAPYDARWRSDDVDIDATQCDALCAIVRAGVDVRTRLRALDFRTAASAASAATRVALALWARAVSPITNTLTDAIVRIAMIVAREASTVIRTTEPKVLIGWALAFVGAAYLYHLCWRLMKHLRRARYRNKLKFFIIRVKLRAQRRVKAVMEPYARVYRRVAGVGRAVKRWYLSFVGSIRSKSRVAASALPHGLFLVIGLGAFRAMPAFMRRLVRQREVLASVALLVPMARTMYAVESDAIADVSKWLRFWASCAPLMLTLHFPFLYASVRLLFPFWPELLVLFTFWLNSRLTRGSELIVDAATPLVTRAMAYANVSSGAMGRLRVVVRASVRQTLQIGVFVMRFRSKRASDALRLVLDNMSFPLVTCTIFFFTPGLMTVYGCDIAGLVIPFIFTIDSLNEYYKFKATPEVASRAETRKEMEKRYEDKLRNLLTYWLAHAMIWSLSQELSTSALRWVPLLRHAQLAGIYWLQVFGGSQMITARMQSIKETIVADHQKALKAAISADLEASEAEGKEKSRSSSPTSEKTSLSSSPMEIGADGLRKRFTPSKIDAD